MERELILKEFAGQRCHVVLYVRRDGSKFVRFESHPSYGHPSLEQRDLETLVEKLRNL